MLPGNVEICQQQGLESQGLGLQERGVWMKFELGQSLSAQRRGFALGQRLHTQEQMPQMNGLHTQ